MSLHFGHALTPPRVALEGPSCQNKTHAGLLLSEFLRVGPTHRIGSCRFLSRTPRCDALARDVLSVQPLPRCEGFRSKHMAHDLGLQLQTRFRNNFVSGSTPVPSPYCNGMTVTYSNCSPVSKFTSIFPPPSKALGMETWLSSVSAAHTAAMAGAVEGFLSTGRSPHRTTRRLHFFCRAVDNQGRDTCIVFPLVVFSLSDFGTAALCLAFLAF